MPPQPAWYQGRDAIYQATTAMAFAGDDRSCWRLVPTAANGQPAFLLYRRPDPTADYQPFGVQVITIDGANDQIADITTFFSPELFPLFLAKSQPGQRPQDAVSAS